MKITFVFLFFIFNQILANEDNFAQWIIVNYGFEEITPNGVRCDRNVFRTSSFIDEMCYPANKNDSFKAFSIDADPNYIVQILYYKNNLECSGVPFDSISFTLSDNGHSTCVNGFSTYLSNSPHEQLISHSLSFDVPPSIRNCSTDFSAKISLMFNPSEILCTRDLSGLYYNGLVISQLNNTNLIGFDNNPSSCENYQLTTFGQSCDSSNISYELFNQNYLNITVHVIDYLTVNISVNNNSNNIQSFDIGYNSLNWCENITNILNPTCTINIYYDTIRDYEAPFIRYYPERNIRLWVTVNGVRTYSQTIEMDPPRFVNQNPLVRMDSSSVDFYFEIAGGDSYNSLVFNISTPFNKKSYKSIGKNENNIHIDTLYENEISLLLSNNERYYEIIKGIPLKLYGILFDLQMEIIMVKGYNTIYFRWNTPQPLYGIYNNDILFYVYINDTIPVPHCTNILENSCSFENPINDTLYRFSVMAINNGLSITTLYFPPVLITNQFLPPTIFVLPHTNSANVLYGALYESDPLDTTYFVYLNDSLIYQGKTRDYQFIDLSHDLIYNLTIEAEYSGTRKSATSLFKVYPPLFNLTVSKIYENGEFMVNLSVQGGDPNTHRFFVSKKADSSLMYLQDSKLTLTHQENMSMDVYFHARDKLDNRIMLNETFFFYPKLIFNGIFTQTLLNNSISIYWKSSSGGQPLSSRYDVYLSIDAKSWSKICSLSDIDDLKCNFTNLIDGIKYFVQLSCYNYYFNPINHFTTIKIDSLCDTNDCSGNGICKNNECVCNLNYYGEYCQIYNNHSTTPVIVYFNPTQPIFNISNTYSKFIFSLNEIREVDPSNNIIKSFTLSGENYWILLNSTSEINNPVDNSSIIRNEWIYSTHLQSISFKSISIRFTQFISNSPESTVDYYPISFIDSTQLKYGNIKYEIIIDQWNFENRLNYLEILSTPSTSLDECTTTDANFFNQLKDGGNFYYLTIGNNQSVSQVFGRLNKQAILDNTPKLIDYSLSINENQTSDVIGYVLVSKVPYFEQRLHIDPDFGMLLDTRNEIKTIATSKCNGKEDKTSNLWKIITSSVVGAILLIGIVSAIVYVKRRNNRLKAEKAKFEYKLKTYNLKTIQ